MTLPQTGSHACRWLCQGFHRQSSKQELAELLAHNVFQQSRPPQVELYAPVTNEYKPTCVCWERAGAARPCQVIGQSYRQIGRRHPKKACSSNRGVCGRIGEILPPRLRPTGRQKTTL